MKVKTFIKKEFDDLCFNLANEVIVDGYKPDLIIGIKNGGAIISNKVFNYINITCHPIYTEVSIRHKSSNTYQKIKLDKLFKLLPNCFLNLLRIYQILFYEKLFNWFNYHRKYDVEINFDLDLKGFLFEGNKKILIIDDAIDSGYTMSFIRNYIKCQCIPFPKHKENEIRYCVATTTYKNPIIKPHYSLFERTICRFPWALDIKK